MIAAAMTTSSGVHNVRWLLGDVRTLELEPGGYDVVTAIASVHHLPADEGLVRLAELVRPGGTVAVLGLARGVTLPDYLAGVLAIPADIAVGTWKAAQRTGSSLRDPGPNGPPVTVPLRDPQVTLDEVRTEARRLMPEARLRRHLFYRYSLVWQRPITSSRGLL